MSNLALPLLVLDATGSAAEAGLVGALGRLPYLLLALIAGVLVDRWNRKWIMVACDLVQALAFATLAAAVWTGRLAIVQLYVVALVEGALFTFFSVAEAAALPRVVAKDQLAPALAQREIAWSGANIIGPCLGGLLYGLARFLPFGVDALSHDVSALFLLLIRIDLRGAVDERGRGLRHQVGDALRWLWCHPDVLFLTLLSGGFELALSGTFLALIVFLHSPGTGAAGIGLTLAIGAAGTTAGYLVAPAVQRRFALRPVVLGALWLLAIFWFLYGFLSDPVTIGIVMGTAGGTASVYIVVDMAYRVSLVPDALQGRLSSVFGLLGFGVQSLSLGAGGGLVELVGPRAAIMAVAACLLGLALTASWTWHRPDPDFGADRSGTRQ